MLKDVLYEIAKQFVKGRKVDRYVFFTESLRKRKLKISYWAIAGIDPTRAILYYSCN